MAVDLEQTIEDIAKNPKSVTSDGQNTTEHSLSDLIAADKYLAEKEAAAKPGRGMRITKLIPPGAV